MITLENVSKTYSTNNGVKSVLSNVSIKIPTEKNIAILGLNGSGKSTLLRMLGGIDYPTRGRIYSDKSFSWPMGLSGGFQGGMTGRHNVKFICRIHGKDDTDIAKAINFVEDFSELGDYFDMPIKSYSSGMKSRLGFGLSLFFDFDYLLIDEALSVGDKNFKKKSKAALMNKIKSSHVILVSHSMPTLVDLCDVAIYLHDGHLTYFDNVEEAIEAYQAH